MRASIPVLLLAFAASSFQPCPAQDNANLQTYFKQDIGLSDSEIGDIRNGKVVTKVLDSKDPDDILIFGAVYIHSKPDRYVEWSQDVRRRKAAGSLDARTFSDPPRLSDLSGFTFEEQDFESLKNCKVGDCGVQMPASSIQQLRSSVDWSAPDVDNRLNQALQREALELLESYQREGNSSLGVYHDKKHPVDVAAHFKEMLSYSRALPRYLPDFYNYLLSYPQGRPAQVQDSFYWAKISFGLRPTLRLVHVMTLQRSAGSASGYVVAEKQLYANHYFRTALDLTFCIPEPSGKQQSGFYLIKVIGSEQGGLSGFKGSLIRKNAISRSVSSMEKSVEAIKKALEQSH